MYINTHTDTIQLDSSVVNITDVGTGDQRISWLGRESSQSWAYLQYFDTSATTIYDRSLFI